MAVTDPSAAFVLPGALVAVDSNDQKSLVVFQYNPAELSRTLKPQYVTQKKSGSTQRFTSGPTESISMTVKLTTLGTRAAGSSGLLGQVAALELLLYPEKDQLTAYKADMLKGTLWAVPPAAPRVYLIWGAGRIMPVVVESVTVTEQLHDEMLNPITAEVKLDLSVITFLESDETDFNLLLVHLSAMLVDGPIASTTNLATRLSAIVDGTGL